MKKTTLLFIILLFPLYIAAQRVSLGSCVTADGGQYKGEMFAGKPNGKGNAIYKNGDTYEVAGESVQEFFMRNIVLGNDVS